MVSWWRRARRAAPSSRSVERLVARQLRPSSRCFGWSSTKRRTWWLSHRRSSYQGRRARRMR
eukprot:6196635-Pleurochrysis_carterae.AAC.2